MCRDDDGSCALQDIGLAQPPRWLTRAFSLLERDDLSVDLRDLHTLQKVGGLARTC